jgi:hypothetical protein
MSLEISVKYSKATKSYKTPYPRTKKINQKKNQKKHPTQKKKQQTKKKKKKKKKKSYRED